MHANEVKQLLFIVSILSFLQSKRSTKEEHMEKQHRSVSATHPSIWSQPIFQNAAIMGHVVDT